MSFAFFPLRTAVLELGPWISWYKQGVCDRSRFVTLVELTTDLNTTEHHIFIEFELDVLSGWPRNSVNMDLMCFVGGKLKERSGVKSITK